MSWNKTKQATLSKMKIRFGAHSAAQRDERPQDVQVCILEAVSYIQHGVISDTPPCVSAVIRDLMIERNDELETDKDRAKLRALVPDIIHTAPTQRNRGIEHYRKPVVTWHTKGYQVAEEKRQAIIDAVAIQQGGHDEDGPGYIDVKAMSVREFNALIRKLADIRRWES